MRPGWRAQVLLVIVPVAAIAFGLIALLPRPHVASVDAPSRASETRCLPFATPRNVHQLNTLVGSLRSNGEFQGADVGADVKLTDGRRLWVFGDTLRSASFSGQRFVRNSMLVFAPGCAGLVLPASRGALLPDRSDGVGYWPMSIAKVARAGYDLVGVSANRVSSDDKPGDASAFTNLGPAIALFIVPTGQTPQLLQVVDLGPDRADRSVPAWGAATAVDGEWVYLYGTANPGRDLVFGYSLQVARVRIDDILDQSAWRYWDGSAWQRSAARAVRLIPAEGGVSQTLSVFSQGGSWYAVSKRDEFVGSDLVIWKAPGPTGPFAPGPVAATIPSGASTLRYMPLAHPDLLPEPGTVVVSYSRNSPDVAKVEEDPFLYRPRFLRVPLP